MVILVILGLVYAMGAPRLFDAEGCGRRFAAHEPQALQPGTHGAALATLLNFSPG